jgi:hypothetical protein
MVPEAQRLHAALVSAFPAYSTALFADRGYALDRQTVDLIGSATAQLDLDLAEELERPFVEQRRTPLEVFGTALGTLNPVLADAGIEASPQGRPSDPYALAPGSSAALGEAVQTAHVRWGAAKATALTSVDRHAPPRPAVIVLTMDRVTRQQLCDAAEKAGYQCHGARNPSAVASALATDAVKLAFVDLAHRAAYESVERLTKAGVPTTVFGTSIDDLTETGLRAAGVKSVVERDRLLSEPGESFPRIA